MALSRLDPRSALIVIDLQHGILALPTAHPSGPVLDNARRLAEAFRASGLPVVWVNVDGAPPGRAEQARNMKDLPAGWSTLSPQLGVQAGDHRVTKHSWGAFTATGLEAWLRERGITQVVLAGISTSIGVETTARQAFEAGFNVAVAIDACTDTRAPAHDNSLAFIFPRLGETAGSDDVIRALGNAPP